MTGARKRILVSGGAGFLGSNLCRRLVREGHHVICLDNFQTGRRGNLKSLPRQSYEVIRHDLTEGLPKGIGPVDQIYNLACAASPVHYQQDPIHTLLTSLRGAHHLLELSQETGARIFQASTSEVYGDPDVHPQREDYTGRVNPVGPHACYDEGKRCAEALFFDFRRHFGVDVKVGRIFNTYGPHMRPDDGRVVSNFIVQALRGEPITIYGDGSQTRSFCYVDDLIDVMTRFMASGPDLTGPLNMGNPEEVTVIEVAELILELTGSPSRLVARPLPVDDPARRCPDIALARERLGWEPRVPLRAGLAETIGYFDALLGGGRGKALPRMPGAAPGTAAAWEVADE